MNTHRLTVLGDSFSAGWGDPRPGGGYRGWVSRLSALLGLPTRSVCNLAEYGATSQRAVDFQLPRALRNKGPLVVACVGVNDLLGQDNGYDLERTKNNIRTMFDALAGEDTTVVTANYPDIPGNLLVSDIDRQKLRRRFAAFNEALPEIAGDAGVLCVDLRRSDAWAGHANWDSDRLHPGPVLHQRFAEQIVSLTQTFELVAA